MSKIEAITVPKWGMTMTEGTLVKWLVSEGDLIKKGDEIVEIETSKLTNVVEASVSGLVRRIVLTAGQTAPVGALAAVVAEESTTEGEIEAFIATYVERMGVTESETSEPTARSIEVNGSAVNVHENGEGSSELIIFLHGFGGDLTTWMFNQDEISGKLQSVAVDLPGHGASDPTRNDDAFAGAVDAVLGVIEDMAADKVHLVGHSFGGGVAAGVAKAIGVKAGSVSLIAPIGLSKSISGDFLMDFVAAERRRPLQKVLHRLVADPSKITNEMVERTLSFKRLEGVSDALSEIAAVIADGDRQLRKITADIEALDCPVCIIWGKEDQIVPMPEDVPANVRFEIIENAGHMPQMEAAGAVNRLLSDVIVGEV